MRTDLEDAAVLARADALLSRGERLRRDRFMFERNRREFLLTHALLRLALSRHAPAVGPREWTFREGPHGRPEIDGPTRAPRLAFNISHTEGLGACLVADEGEVGVDVEAVDRPRDPVRARNLAGIAENFFAPYEIGALRALPELEHRARFFTYWTLKEAYIKARGLGLALPLDRFWFELQGERGALPTGIRIDIAPELHDDAARWVFTLRAPSARHLLATALAGPPSAAPIVVGPPLLK